MSSFQVMQNELGKVVEYVRGLSRSLSYSVVDREFKPHHSFIPRPVPTCSLRRMSLHVRLASYRSWKIF